MISGRGPGPGPSGSGGTSHHSEISNEFRRTAIRSTLLLTLGPRATAQGAENPKIEPQEAILPHQDALEYRAAGKRDSPIAHGDNPVAPGRRELEGVGAVGTRDDLLANGGKTVGAEQDHGGDQPAFTEDSPAEDWVGHFLECGSLRERGRVRSSDFSGNAGLS
jgi:hypothetical protein